MRRVIFGCALLLLALSVPMQAAGTVTVTSLDFVGAPSGTRYTKYTVAWTSTAGGAVSGNAFTVKAGRLISARFHPGTTTPSDLYDVTLVETGGVADLLLGVGADCTNAADVLKQWEPAPFLDGSRTLDVVVANAGNAKTGTVILLVQTN